MGLDDPNSERGPWCVACGAEKRNENHWFVLNREGAFFSVPQLIGRKPDKGWEPVCGEACAQKKLSEWMSGRLKLPTSGSELRENSEAKLQIGTTHGRADAP